MNYTQNEKIMSITEKTLVVGVDIAKTPPLCQSL
jgi:hypothetical protein